jgi:response regulator RpfG family c-di-GMP phosphodiesterase
VTGGFTEDDVAATLFVPSLARVHASGAASQVDAAGLTEIGLRLGAGPAAAAPLRPRDLRGEDAGLLVVARAADGRPFEGEDLRVVAVAASALGDVFHAVRATERAEAAYVESLLDVVTATEHRAPWFLDHSTRVHDLSVRLARHVGLAIGDVEVLDTASRLLDIGRLHLQDDVLAKPGRLTGEEWRLLRSHPEIADTIVRPLGRLRDVKPVIRHHHENWDGSGYPDGLRGDEIPFLAALVRITDTYAALTAARPWRAALSRDEAVRRLVESSGTHFHPQLVAAFAEMEMAEGEAPAW